MGGLTGSGARTPRTGEGRRGLRAPERETAACRGTQGVSSVGGSQRGLGVLGLSTGLWEGCGSVGCRRVCRSLNFGSRRVYGSITGLSRVCARVIVRPHHRGLPGLTRVYSGSTLGCGSRALGGYARVWVGSVGVWVADPSCGGVCPVLPSAHYITPNRCALAGERVECANTRVITSRAAGDGRLFLSRHETAFLNGVGLFFRRLSFEHSGCVGSAPV